jgi:hypothetical protein
MDDKREKRKEYMRNYQLTRYYKNQSKALDEQNTMRLKKKINIPVEDIEKYGIHLANVYKFKKLLTILPPEMVKELYPV